MSRLTRLIPAAITTFALALTPAAANASSNHDLVGGLLGKVKITGLDKTTGLCANQDDVPAAGNDAQMRAATLCLLNIERAKKGMPIFKDNAALRSAAKKFSGQMVAQSFFDHVSPGGSTFVDRIVSARYVARHGSWALGENIGWGTDNLASPAEMVDAWMHSAEHKANILNRKYRDIGIGIAVGSPEKGLGDIGATYTTDFGFKK